MKLIQKLKSNYGISMLYVLASLIVTAFIGTAMLKMVTSDSFANALYSTSATARSTAKSGVIAGVASLESKGNDILPFLTAWIDANTNADHLCPVTYGAYATPESRTWLCGTENSFLNISAECDFKYQTKMTAFDPEKFTVTITSQGIGSGGARAAMTTVYYLDGLEYSQGGTTNSNAPQYALQAENGNYEFDCKLIVDGNTAFSDGLTLNSGPFNFNGTFRLDPHRQTGSAQGLNIRAGGNSIACEFRDELYTAARYSATGIVKFNKSIGFDNEVNVSGQLPIFSSSANSTVFINENMVRGSGVVDLNNWTLQAYNSAFSFTQNLNYYFKNYREGAVPEKTRDLPQKLGLGDRPKEITFNCEKALNHPHVITVGSDQTVTEAMLNSWWDNEQGQLFGDKFIVVHFDDTYENSSGRLIDKSKNGWTPSGEKFRGKAIIIVDSYKWESISMATTPSANVAIYIREYCKVANTFKEMDYFRGYIYVNDVKTRNADYDILDESTLQPHEISRVNFYEGGGNPSYYKGSIYASPKANTKFMGGRNRLHHIEWDQSVIDELDLVGIFTETGTVPQTEKKLQLKPGYNSVVPILVNQNI